MRKLKLQVRVMDDYTQAMRWRTIRVLIDTPQNEETLDDHADMYRLLGEQVKISSTSTRHTQAERAHEHLPAPATEFTYEYIDLEVAS